MFPNARQYTRAFSGRAFFLDVLLCALPIFFVSVWRLSPATIPMLEDEVLTFAVLDQMAQGVFPRLGPPSHLGGRHFGALVYWFFGICSLLGGKSIFGATIVYALLSSLLHSILPALLGQAFRQRILAVLCFTLVFSGSGFAELLSFIWHGNGIPLASSLFLSSAIGAFLFCSPALLVLGGTIAAQWHYSLGLIVLPIGLITVGALVQELRRMDTRRFSFWGRELCLMLIVVLLWIPALFGELRGEGNLGSILLGIQSQSGEAPGYSAALWNLRHVLAMYIYPLGSPRWLLPLGVILLVPFLRKQRAILLALCATALPVGLVYISTAFVRVPLKPYFLFSTLPFIVAALFLLAASSAKRHKALPLLVLAPFCVGFSQKIFSPKPIKLASYHSLAFVKGVRSLLPTEFKSERFTIETFAHARHVQAALDYEFGNPSRVPHTAKMSEFPALYREQTSPQLGLGVTCPYPNDRALARTVEELKTRWAVVSPLDGSLCGRACRGCSFLLLQGPEKRNE